MSKIASELLSEYWLVRDKAHHYFKLFEIEYYEKYNHEEAMKLLKESQKYDELAAKIYLSMTSRE